MIKPLTPVDACALVNGMAKQLCGEDALKTVDLSNFVDVSSLVLSTGYDNVIGQISSLIGKVVNDAKAYDGKFWSIMADDQTFSNRKLRRKYYAKEAKQATSVNTDLNTPIGDGKNPETDGFSQWTQSWTPVLEEFFGGYNGYSYQMPTVSEDALLHAFRSAEELAGFMNGQITKALNEITLEKETWARQAVLNKIGGIYQMVQDGDLGGECIVDLIDYANKRAGTNYTRDQWLQEHREDLMKQIAVKLETDSKRLQNYTTKYHWSPAKSLNGINYVLKDFTPASSQKFIYYAPLMLDLETNVLPNVFHNELLNGIVNKATAKSEGVDFWQSFDDGYEYDGAKIDVEVNTPTNNVKKPVILDFVFGMLYDENGCMLNVQFEKSRSTPVHAATGIINTFNQYSYCPINTFTDNAIIYVLGTGSQSEAFVGDGVEDDFVLTGDVTEILKITINDEVVDAEDYTYDSDTQTVTFDTAPANKADIVIVYK